MFAGTICINLRCLLPLHMAFKATPSPEGVALNDMCDMRRNVTVY